MVPVLAAVTNWESAYAQALLRDTLTHYRTPPKVSLSVRYSCLKTDASSGPEPGVQETVTFKVKRTGQSYQVTEESGESRTISGEKAAADPLLAYDHELTRWFGFRQENLTYRLLPTDARGPFFGWSSGPNGTVIVRQTFHSKDFPRFVVAYTIDPSSREVRSYSSSGTVPSVSETPDRPDGACLWNQTVEIVEQRFGG